MDKWSKEEMTELKKFWKSKVGEKYKERIEDTKTVLLQQAMGSLDSDTAFRFAAIANGFDSVLQDIEAVIAMNEKKEDAPAKKK